MAVTPASVSRLVENCGSGSAANFPALAFLCASAHVLCWPQCTLLYFTGLRFGLLARLKSADVVFFSLVSSVASSATPRPSAALRDVEGKESSTDLWIALRLDDVEVMIVARQLGYTGHVARHPR